MQQIKNFASSTCHATSTTSATAASLRAFKEKDRVANGLSKREATTQKTHGHAQIKTKSLENYSKMTIQWSKFYRMAMTEPKTSKKVQTVKLLIMDAKAEAKMQAAAKFSDN